MGRLLSGRVGVTSYAGLSTFRNQTNGFPSFLGLNEAEPSLGLPSNNEFILYANTNGERFWAAPPSGSGGGSAFGFTVQDQGTTAVGFAGSTTTLNFEGNGVTVSEAKENIGVGGTIQVAIATVTINKNTLDFTDANEFTVSTGVTTVRVGAGLSVMELPVGQNASGITSIFSIADSKIKFQDIASAAAGNEVLEDINIIRIGVGLTLSQPSVGIASLSPTGILEHLSVSGIASSPIFDGNLTGNVTGNVTGNITGNVTGDSSGTHTGAVTGDVTGNVTGDLTGNISSSSGNVIVTPTTSVLEVRGDGSSIEGQIQLNCHVNTHGQKITAADHSVAASNTLTLPGGSTIGNADATLVSDTGTQTLTNKTLTSPTITGTGAIAGTFTGNLTGNVTSTGNNTMTNVSGTTATYTSFVGSLIGPATQLTINQDNTDTSTSVLFSGTATGNQSVKSSTALTFNAATGELSATSFSGTLSSSNLSGALPALDGSALTDVTTSTIDITSTDSTSADHFITFVDTAGGSGEALRSDTDLKYNPSTNTLTASVFNGSCTGLTGDPSVTVTNISLKGNITPDVNGIRSLGSDALRFSNIYTSDMHFSNVNYGVNDVDGTSGSWTLQEGDENIFMINNLTGKKYKISLTEV
tara:strand:+ start:2316 stop:4238 length:1923 start_codon:yes stop_codon:yes gene_type:complete